MSRGQADHGGLTVGAGTLIGARVLVRGVDAVGEAGRQRGVEALQLGLDLVEASLQAGQRELGALARPAGPLGDQIAPLLDVGVAIAVDQRLRLLLGGCRPREDVDVAALVDVEVEGQVVPGILRDPGRVRGVAGDLRASRDRRLALQQHRRHALRQLPLLGAHRHQDLHGGLPAVGRASLVTQEQEQAQSDGDEQD